MTRNKLFAFSIFLLLLAADALLSLVTSDHSTAKPAAAMVKAEREPSIQTTRANVPAPTPVVTDVQSGQALLTKEGTNAPQTATNNAGNSSQLASDSAMAVAAQRHVKRARPTQLHPSALPSRTTSPGRQDRLALFADTAFTVRWETMADNGSNNFAWYGRLREDRLSAVTLTRVGDYAIIEVQSPKLGHYEVRAQDGQAGEVRQFDAERLKGNGKCFVEMAAFGDNGDPTAAAPVEEAAGSVVAAAVTPVTIDVLMIYTTKARDAAGGRPAIVALAQSAGGKRVRR